MENSKKWKKEEKKCGPRPSNITIHTFPIPIIITSYHMCIHIYVHTYMCNYHRIYVHKNIYNDIYNFNIVDYIIIYLI